MSILNKLMDTMRLTENDDDYFDEEDYEEEKPVIKKRSFGKRDEEMDDYRHEEESKPRFLPRSSNNKVVQMRPQHGSISDQTYFHGGYERDLRLPAGWKSCCFKYGRNPHGGCTAYH